jgi:hypothetical protein
VKGLIISKEGFMQALALITILGVFMIGVPAETQAQGKWIKGASETACIWQAEISNPPASPGCMW